MSLSSLTLQTNVASLSAQSNLHKTEGMLNTAMERLSSGFRINKAADDAAGLAISEKLRAHIRGLGQAQRNANDGISMLQTAEGALNESGNMLVRMRELAVQSANGSLGSSERNSLHSEFTQLRTEINRIANSTEFNGTKLIDGTMSAGVTFQVGIKNVAANDRITVSVSSATATAIGVTSGMTLSTTTGAQNAIALLDTAITNITNRRGTIGAVQNRLFTSISNTSAMIENLNAANSRIRDADIAAESATMTKSQILMQSGVSMLAQANQLPGLAARLIG